jgi:hypothetical protein
MESSSGALRMNAGKVMFYQDNESSERSRRKERRHFSLSLFLYVYAFSTSYHHHHHHTTIDRRGRLLTIYYFVLHFLFFETLFPVDHRSYPFIITTIIIIFWSISAMKRQAVISFVCSRLQWSSSVYHFIIILQGSPRNYSAQQKCGIM